MGYIWKMGLILIGCTVVTLLFGALAARRAAEASAGYAKNLRHDLYYHVQDFSFSNFERFSTASLVTRMTTDVTNVQMAFQMRKRILFRAPVMLVFSLVMSFLIIPELAIIFLCVTPFLVVACFSSCATPTPIFERVFKTYDRLNQVVQENCAASAWSSPSCARSMRTRSSAKFPKTSIRTSPKPKRPWPSTCADAAVRLYGDVCSSPGSARA